MRKTLAVTGLCLAAWVTAALVLPAVQAAVYKWVDADGKVHYSQSPPLDRPAEKVKTPSQPPTSQPPRDAAPKAQAPKTISTEKKPDTAAKDQNQAAQKDKKETKKEKREREAQRQENCDKARHNLEGLENRPRARKTDPDGTLVYMTDEERQGAIEQSRKRVSELCE